MSTVVLPRPGPYPTIISGSRAERFEEALTPNAVADRAIARFKEQALRSEYWRGRALFDDAWRRLRATEWLKPDWDTYGADAPNAIARDLAAKVLIALSERSLPPARLMPSVEWGIAITFVADDRRATVEAYNTGELGAVVYAGSGEPSAWEVGDSPEALVEAIRKIRVHLAV